MSIKEQNPQNGSMASSMEEMKQLGRQMEKMRDEHELKADHRISDPVQSNEAPTIQKRKND